MYGMVELLYDMFLVQVGLLNPYTGEFQHPQSDETSTLGDAVTQQYIAGKSVIVQDPTSGLRYYLDDALTKRIINPSNGELCYYC